MTPGHISSPHWEHAVSIARQACARIFRDGGEPIDALIAFGVSRQTSETADWSRAVDLIAQSLCSQPSRRAA